MSNVRYRGMKVRDEKDGSEVYDLAFTVSTRHKTMAKVLMDAVEDILNRELPLDDGTKQTVLEVRSGGVE